MKVIQFQIVSGTLYRLYEDGTITSCYQGDAGIVEAVKWPLDRVKNPGRYPFHETEVRPDEPITIRETTTKPYTYVGPPDEAQPDKEVDE